MKLDILVLAAHPDDAELGCAGTLAKHVSLGHKVGIVDLTQGELGTRGTPELRAEEAKAAATILNLSVRENLGLRDGFFENDENDQLAIIRTIRRYQPRVIITNAVRDRHPDHARAAELVYRASFLAGLVKIETQWESRVQAPWRPSQFYHFIQSQSLTPDFVVDITEFWKVKMEAIMAFKSQFYDPSSDEPTTYISRPEFLKMLEARAIELGHGVGVQYAEGFTVRKYPGVNHLFDLF